MAAASFPAALAHVLKYEGGWADHPRDPGGATMKGVTLATYSAWLKRPATKAELKAIPDVHLNTIYRQNYWGAIRGDDLPAGVDLVVFDFAVNSGPGRAAKHLQMALGIPVDGAIGPVTLQHARAADPRAVIEQVTGQRLAFLKSLPTWPTFGRGWGARVTATEAAGKGMIR